MILRCTAKLLDLLGEPRGSLSAAEASDDDWYANLLWIDRRKCLLLAHAGTLFAAFAPDVRKAQLVPFGRYAVELIEEQLRLEQLPSETFGRLDPDEVVLARTASRSVLAYMNDMTTHLRYRIAVMGGPDRADVAFLNRYLRRTLHNRGGYVTPLDLVAERLLAQQ